MGLNLRVILLFIYLPVFPIFVQVFTELSLWILRFSVHIETCDSHFGFKIFVKFLITYITFRFLQFFKKEISEHSVFFLRVRFGSLANSCGSENYNLSFIRNGGGLITAETGWGWKQLNPNKSLHTGLIANRILNKAGLAIADGTLNDNAPDGRRCGLGRREVGGRRGVGVSRSVLPEYLR